MAIITTADIKFTIDDIHSTLKTTPPDRASTAAVTTIPVTSSTITIDAISDVTELDIDEFTTNVQRVMGVDNYWVVTGDGIFDKVMETATEHLAVQYINGRIRGEEYSATYIQTFQAVLQAASNMWLQKGTNEKQLALDLAKANATNKLQAEIENARNRLQADTTNAQFSLQIGLGKNQGDLQWAIALLQRDAQEGLVQAQIDSEAAKRHLYYRQIEGFDEDYKHKILKICMDSWAVGFSVAKDSFEASGIPAPMTKLFIDDLLNTYIVPDLDNYDYGRPWMIEG